MPRDRSEKAFLGTGWAFPFDLAQDGAVAMAQYEEDVQQAIRIILGTSYGERLMRPRFGAGLSDFLFEPVSPTTARRLEARVYEALIDWEHRIDIGHVRVTQGHPERNRLDIEVAYRIRATNAQHNLVYPFYLEERPS